ncbi:hypothetical protein BDW69DRAFT_176376 [Aspergillus filifer]
MRLWLVATRVLLGLRIVMTRHRESEAGWAIFNVVGPLLFSYTPRRKVRTLLKEGATDPSHLPYTGSVAGKKGKH